MVIASLPEEGTASLPEGRYFTLAWTIPDEIGGLTSSMLHRSRAFAEQGGKEVAVLTFDARADYPAVEHRLRDAGEMVPGMRLINLWDWCGGQPVAAAPNPLPTAAHVFTPIEGVADKSASRDGVEIRRWRYAADGTTVLQTDFLRPDGTLLATHRRDTRRFGALGGRCVVLCDAEGRPVRSWLRVRSLYRFWLDRMTAGEGEVYLIADGKPINNFLHTYRRAGRVTVHVVHGSHLAGNIGPWGRLRSSRAEAFRHLSEFDAVTLLTDRQRRDAQMMFGRKDNLHVVSNSRRMSDTPVQTRSVGAGAFVGRLSKLKRPQHAVRAVAKARRRAPGVTLDVYGDGSRRSALEELSSGGAVRVHGWAPDARERLAEASFLLFTSRSEGFGLVLLEAMAVGCIPISYNIRYGPAELIEHGRNGLLVRSGSIHGLARAIVRLQRMPPAEVAAMRDAARRTAERYTDEPVLQAWAGALAAARARNLAGPSPGERR